VKLFFSFARQAVVELSQYVFEFWMQVLGCIISMYGVYWLWTTLYLRRGDLFSVSLEQMLTYAQLAMIVDFFFNASNLPRWYITRQMRTGDIQMDLLRPLDFLIHMLARASGSTVYGLVVLCIPAALLGAVFLKLQAPASLAAGVLFLPSLALAFLISFSLNFLLGVVSVYAIEIRRISWVYFSVVSFLSGQMVPLWIFPPLLAKIAGVLPFPSMVSTPLSIYIGRLDGAAALQAVGVQALWAAALLLLGRWAWSRAQGKLIVQGG
jgi:ABC-2 type transport system permease protein